MTIEEFSNEFDVKYKALTGEDAPTLNEYEKSLFLTQAQEEIVKELSESFESSAIVRESLRTLIKQVLPTEDSAKNLGSNLVVTPYTFPEDCLRVISEYLKLYNSDSCKEAILPVIPITHDEYSDILCNPFRGASSHRALRIDVEKSTFQGRIVCINLISSRDVLKDYRYVIQYLKIPSPIILEDLPDGLTIRNKTSKTLDTSIEIPSILHYQVLNRAVQLALLSKLNKNN